MLSVFSRMHFCVLLLISTNTAYSSESLTMVRYPWPPWNIQLPDNKWSGIAVDTMQVIALCTQNKLSFIEVENIERVQREWGKSVSLEAAVSPIWRTEQKKTSLYSEQLFTTTDIIVAKKGAFKDTRSARDFYGETLGVTVGFYYPEGFSDAMDTGSIVTSSSNPKTLLPKLLRGRLKAIIINEDEFNYLLTHSGYDFTYNINDFEVIYRFGAVPLHVRVHQQFKHLIPSINSVITELKSVGFLKNIQWKYLNPERNQTPVSIERCPF